MSSCPLRDTLLVPLPNKALLCALLISHTPDLSSTCDVQARVCTLDVGTPSSFTPADLPLDERDLRPCRVTRSLHLLKKKAGREGIFKHVALTPIESCQDQAGLQDSHFGICEMGKVRQRCWQL